MEISELLQRSSAEKTLYFFNRLRQDIHSKGNLSNPNVLATSLRISRGRFATAQRLKFFWREGGRWKTIGRPFTLEDVEEVMEEERRRFREDYPKNKLGDGNGQEKEPHPLLFPDLLNDCSHVSDEAILKEIRARGWKGELVLPMKVKL
jgi:hypothetical protein